MPEAKTLITTGVEHTHSREADWAIELVIDTNVSARAAINAATYALTQRGAVCIHLMGLASDGKDSHYRMTGWKPDV